MNEITQENLKRMFDYKDGWLYNRYQRGRSRKGARVGGLMPIGYIQIMLKPKNCYAHRLIFLWHHGYTPKYIDHIDGDKTNNHIENLRECTMGENIANSKSSRGSSRFKGVCWCKARKKWKAEIGYNWKRVFISYHTDEVDAAKAYDKKAVEIFGDFALINFPLENK